MKRVLLKLSGEFLQGNSGVWSEDKVLPIVDQIKRLQLEGNQIGLVVGGGNIFRGATSKIELLDRVSADYVGMLATVMNGIILQNALEKLSIPTRMQSAIEISRICEPYIKRRALRHLEKGRVMLFVAGTGNPYFSTDTASVLRASEMNCDAVFKGTKVDGVYDKDPMKYEDAKRFDNIDFDYVIKNNLKIMDQTAFTLARDINMPIVVFKITDNDSILNTINDKGKYTIISSDI